MTALQEVKSHLVPGHVYRRIDIKRWSNAVDRHLVQLQKENLLLKVSAGMYLCPKETEFGKAPPNERDMVRTFLKDSRFLLTTPNLYNALGVGTTQLYNETVVYNHKRHGLFKLGNRYFHFVMKRHFPLKISNEFLIVDLVDNLNKLPEDRDKVLKLVEEKALSMDLNLRKEAVQSYGSVRARKFFANILIDKCVDHDA